MCLEEVGEPVELGVAGGGERHPRGHERLAGASPDLGEESGAEPVPLEQPVQARSQHARFGVERTVVLSPVAIVEVDPAARPRAAGYPAVANLVAADALTHRFAPPLPRQLGRLEHRVDVEPSEPGDVAAARLDRVTDRVSEYLVAAADPEDERVGSLEDGAVEAGAAEPLEVGDR